MGLGTRTFTYAVAEERKLTTSNQIIEVIYYRERMIQVSQWRLKHPEDCLR